MTTSDNIKKLLDRGFKPSEIVKMGYAKSTVYTIYHKWKRQRIERALKVLDSLDSLIICLFIDVKESEILCKIDKDIRRFKIVKIKEGEWLITE